MDDASFRRTVKGRDFGIIFLYSSLALEHALNACECLKIGREKGFIDFLTQEFLIDRDFRWISNVERTFTSKRKFLDFVIERIFL